MASFLFKASIVASVLLLQACASNAPEALSLTKAHTSQPIVVPERISSSVTRGLLSITWETGLVPGVYAPTYENAGGVFYQGPSRPVWERSSSNLKSITLRVGGIWVPKQRDALPRMYIVRDAENHTVTDIDEYIARNAGGSAGGSASGATVRSTDTAAVVATTGLVGLAIANSVAATEAGTYFVYEQSTDQRFNESLLKVVGKSLGTSR